MRIPYEKGLDPASQIYILTPSNLAVRLLYHINRAGHYYANAHYCVERPSYPGFFLAYVKAGGLTIQFRGETSHARSGDFCLIDCREPHAYQAIAHTDFIWLHFGGANTSDFIEEILRKSGMVFHPSNADRIVMQMTKILDLLHAYESMDEQAASTRIYAILCALLFSNSIDETLSPIISTAQAYLREHLSEAVSVPILAAHCHLSASQFTRLFKQYTGQSPHEYTVNLRINQAKILLVETDLPVTEIASRVGYDYCTSFEATFKKKVGLTPRKFRQLSI
ncbi:MAG: AraC family transcriptional regulator [Eubacteriales bacterium]|nr:AraC family transcriptional regulator [Eubacteriales bacterium]